MAFIIKSQKNEDQVVLENFIFTKKRKCINRLEWKCVIKSCKAIAHSCYNYEQNMDSFIIVKIHNHLADERQVIKKIYRNKMNEKFFEPISTPRYVVSNVLRGVNESVISSIGNIESIYRNLRRKKMKIINPPPFLYSSIRISEVLGKTHLSTPFYRYGPDNYGSYPVYDNICIFFSDVLLESLKQNRIWCVDGTFSVVPKPYLQLITISYIRNHHVFPVFFCLLKDKKFETYVKMFVLIKKMVPDLEPHIVKTDFESGLISAIKLSFINTKVSGCIFHLAQALFRKIQEEKLVVFYKTDFIFKKFVKSLIGLAFVKKEEIVSTFNCLFTHDSFPPLLTDTYQYFYRNYIGSDGSVRFPIELWHCKHLIENDIPRTNNAIEGWHHVFNSTFFSSKYSLPIFFAKLKDEEDFIRVKDICMNLGQTFIRKKKYIVMEGKLIDFLVYSGDENFGLSFILSLADILFY
jgi:hypothetical protein